MITALRILTEALAFAIPNISINDRTSIFDEIGCVARLLLCYKRVCAQKRKWLCYSPHTLINKPDVRDKEIGEKERKKDKKAASCRVPRETKKENKR